MSAGDLKDSYLACGRFFFDELCVANGRSTDGDCLVEATNRMAVLLLADANSLLRTPARPEKTGRRLLGKARLAPAQVNILNRHATD